MRLDDYIELEANDRAERRRLAQEKSYEIMDHLSSFQDRFEGTVQNGDLFGSVSPSIFVGRSNYPNVSTGILSPVGHEETAAQFETNAGWYTEGVSISDVFERRTSLLNSTQTTPVDTSVHDAWDGFLGVQREVAIADRPVQLEIGLDGSPNIDFDITTEDVATPTGPRARARDARVTENPHVPRAIQKTLEDDDWAAQGAMTYLYTRGFDVYDINTILSAGALGQGANRRLVPTRWSITAVDDTIGQFLRGRTWDDQGVDTVQVWRNEYLGNAFWIILAPGQWEFELVELKAPGSIWNPDPEAGMWLASDYEGKEGRTGYVEETAGAYYAARLAVLEQLASIGRQAKVLVIRHVSDEYWGPVGVWQIREAIRHAFDGEHGETETFRDAVEGVLNHVPVSMTDLRRQSTMVSGLQTNLFDFGTTNQ
ncbi:DNA repair protein NreA [Natronocalculus amylovorans]|uniref:DNA repair protein n=1 Tax=Natronocalculus amylovorans TaxID=2917812 RepID=A0AAE3KAU5_9EURY|nr:DNA repair protein NreA [Natronocalculus amylovorans]MCL9818530.1 Nre family DNA repair protein [Natronocalculus amylovorans]